MTPYKKKVQQNFHDLFDEGCDSCNGNDGPYECSQYGIAFLDSLIDEVEARSTHCQKVIPDGTGAICTTRLDCHLHDWREGKEELVARTREEDAEKITAAMRERCVVNVDGECKYWEGDKWGYDGLMDDSFAHDKFFPQEVLDYLKSSLTSPDQTND